MMPNHVCHALGCNTQVPPSMFMCKQHWFMVPKALRDQVWAHYVEGQEDRKDPTDEYLTVAREAQRVVKEAEDNNRINREGNS